MASTSKEMFNEISSRMDNIEKMLNLLLAKDLVDGVEKVVGEQKKVEAEKTDVGKQLETAVEKKIVKKKMEEEEYNLKKDFVAKKTKRLLESQNMKYGGLYSIGNIKYYITAIVPNNIYVTIRDIEYIEKEFFFYCNEHDCKMEIVFVYDEINSRHKDALLSHKVCFYHDGRLHNFDKDRYYRVFFEKNNYGDINNIIVNQIEESNKKIVNQIEQSNKNMSALASVISKELIEKMTKK